MKTKQRVENLGEAVRYSSDSQKNIIQRTIKLFSEVNGNLTVQRIQQTHITKFANYLKTAKRDGQPKYSPNTVNIYLRWLEYTLTRNGVNLAVKEAKMKEQESKRGYINEEQVHNFEQNAAPSIYKAVFMFSYYTGLRYSDIIKIKPQNIKDNTLYFKAKKTGKSNMIPLNQKAAALLPELKGVSKLRTQTTEINRYLAREFSKLGIVAKTEGGENSNVTIHTARHAFATTLLSHDIDICTVQKLLGHSDIKTTQRYAVVVDKKKIEAVNVL